MKKTIITLTILLLLHTFILLNVATRKVIDFPCQMQVMDKLEQDSLVPAYFMAYARDTIVIRAYKDSSWDEKTAALCKLLKDSCNQTGYKFLIVDTSTNQSFFNTPYGKKIYFRQCQ